MLLLKSSFAAVSSTPEEATALEREKKMRTKVRRKIGIRRRRTWVQRMPKEEGRGNSYTDLGDGNCVSSDLMKTCDSGSDGRTVLHVDVKRPRAKTTK